MKKATMIGYLARDPELRRVSDTVSVCSFCLGVTQRRGVGKDPVTEWVHVSAWRRLGDICMSSLQKGSRVCVVGDITCHGWVGKDSQAHAGLDIDADEVEFLSPKRGDADDAGHIAPSGRVDQQSGMTVVDDDELPY